MKQNPFKALIQWASAHPIQTILFTFLFTSISVVLGFREDWMVGGLTVFFLGLAGWCLSLWRHGKKIITLLLIAVMVTAPIQQIRAAMYGVGVVVICVGAYCIIKVVKVCQKKFPPKSTNAPPEEFSANADGEYGGVYEYSSIGSCYEPLPGQDLLASPFENLTNNPTTFTLNILPQPGGTVATSITTSTADDSQSWAQFVEEMAGHGLPVTGRPGSEPRYERDGIPCDASAVPLSFDPWTGRVIHGTGGVMTRITVERSLNLETWSPLLTMDVNNGKGLRLVDTTREGQMFYKVSVIKP